MYGYNYDYRQIERANRKRDLFKISNSAGLCCILFFVFSIAVSILVQIVSQGLSPHYSADAVDDFALNLDYIIGTLIPIPLAFFIFAKLNGMKISESLPLGFENKKKIFLTLFVSFGVIIPLRTIVGIFAVIVELIGGPSDVPEFTPVDGLGGAIVMTTVVTIMTGLIEEFAFRGILLTSLRKYGDTFAVIVSSALFGLLHRNPVSVFSAFLLGMVMGYAVIISKSMWTAVIIHTLNNLQAIAFSITSFGSALVFSLIVTMLMVVVGITAIVIAIVYRQKAKGEIKLRKESVLSVGDKISSVVFAPLIIILVVLVIFFDPAMELISSLMKF